MNNNELPLTLRKLQPILDHSRLIISYFLVVAVCIIVGPFSTYENLSLLERIPYWAGIILFCYAIALIVLAFSKWFKLDKTPATYLNHLLHSLVIASFIAVFVYGVNFMVFGNIESLPNIFSYLGLTIPISLVVSSVVYMLIPKTSPNSKETHAVFLKRLPVHLGKDLYSISVSDHYVEAATAKGTHMVLMRFSDALNEVDAINGIQLHRSHWIALDSVASVDKRDGKLVVKLKNGRQYPVSRSRLQAVKKALNV